jgi:uncharacterized protein DUF5670
MFWVFLIVLIIMWLHGMVSTVTLSGFIHILLILALAAIVIRIVEGQRL